MRTQLTLAGALAALGLLFGASACGQKKIAECNGLIEVINKGVNSLENAPKVADPSDTTVFKNMAETMDKLAADAARVELTLPELKKYSTDYQAMAKEVAKAARDTVAAAEAKDTTKLTAAKTAMDKAAAQEDPLVESINKFCQAN
jgi:hypothetical protein